MIARGAHEKDLATGLTSFLTNGTVKTNELDEHKPMMFNPSVISGINDVSDFSDQQSIDLTN